MVVMNKANEGIHIDGVDGIIWFRALDENSRILYLQQLGRAIYALDEDNPLPDDKRPTVIDLANNSLTVKIEKEFENIEPIDDLEALTIVTEWINEHNGMIPDRNSSNKQEQHYYAILRRIQNKYSKYLDGFEDFEDLTEEDKIRIEEIIELATEIDLWNIDLPPIPKTRGSKEEFDPFTIEGVLRDFVKFEDEIDRFVPNSQTLKNALEIENWCKLNYGDKAIWDRRLPSQISNNEEEKRLGTALTHLRTKLKQYEEKKVEEVGNAENRNILEVLRRIDEEYGLSQTLKNALEIENWCKENCEDKEIWYRELPKRGGKNEEEKRLANALGTIRTKLKQYKGKELEKVEDEDDRKVLEIIKRIDEEYGLSQTLKNALKVENWCKEKYGDKKIWERKLPTSIATNEEERQMGMILKNLRDYLKRYEEKKIEEVEDEEDRKVLEIIKKLDEEYGLDQVLKNALEIENWCKENYEDKQLSERKLPTKSAKNEKEKRLGHALGNLRQKLKQYEGKELEEVENEEDRRILEVVRRLDAEYNPMKKSRTAKEIAEASISSLIDIEMSDREDQELKALVEKTKEGGIKIDEQS